LTHHNYIQAFHFSVNEGDEISVVKTNLNIAMMRLKSTDFDQHIKKADPDFFEREKELDHKRKERKQLRHKRSMMAKEESGHSSSRTSEKMKRTQTLEE